MKRTLCLILALVMIFSLCACAKDPASSGQTGTNPGTSSESNDPGTKQEESQQAQDQMEEVQANAGVIADFDVKVDESRKSTANTDERLEYLGIIQKFNLADVSPISLMRSEKAIALASVVYESLFRRVGPNEFVGVLAKEWVRTDEYLEVTIYDYIYDQDGNHITADDVIFSYDIYVESGKAQQWIGYVKDYEKTGEYSVRFNFEQPVIGDAFRYSFAIVGIVSQKAYEDHDGMITEACGTGPYKVTDFVASTYVEIEATDNYWQTPELTDAFAVANVQKLHVDIISDSAQQLIALQSGNAAYCQLDANTVVDFLEGGKLAGQYALYSHLDPDTFGVMANCSEQSLLNDINMRLACFYAIDSAGIVKMLGDSMFLSCAVNCSRVPVDYNSEWDKIESYHNVTDYNLVKEYLDKAGYKGETITLLCEEHATKKAIAEVVKNMLEAAGIACKLEVREFALMDTELAEPTHWDLYLSSNGSSAYVVDRIHYNFATLNGKVQGMPTNFMVDEDFQAKLDACKAAMGEDAALTDEIIQYMLDNALEMSICYAQAVTAYEPIFGNLMLRFGENKVIVTACEYYLD